MTNTQRQGNVWRYSLGAENRVSEAADALSSAAEEDLPGGGDARVVLECVVDAMASLKKAQLQLVAIMRQEGSSWEEIGSILGTTRQAAQQLYRVQLLQIDFV